MVTDLCAIMRGSLSALTASELGLLSAGLRPASPGLPRHTHHTRRSTHPQHQQQHHHQEGHSSGSISTIISRGIVQEAPHPALLPLYNPLALPSLPSLAGTHLQAPDDWLLMPLPGLRPNPLSLPPLLHPLSLLSLGGTHPPAGARRLPAHAAARPAPRAGLPGHGRSPAIRAAARPLLQPLCPLRPGATRNKPQPSPCSVIRTHAYPTANGRDVS